MDGQRFDSLARAMATATSRRDVLLGALAGGFGALIGGGRRAGAKPQKVAICHFTDDPAHPYEVISVAQPAVQAHLGHHDSLLSEVECCTNADCDDGDPCTYDVCGTMTRICYHDPIPTCAPCGDGCGGESCCGDHCCTEGSVCMINDLGQPSCCEPCGDTFCCDSYTDQEFIARNCVDGCGFCCNGGNGYCEVDTDGNVVSVGCDLPGNSR